MIATLLLFALAYGGWRAVRALVAPLRALPRRNEDMVLF